MLCERHCLSTHGLIWYVAYGSNLSAARFARYLDASADPTPPRDWCATTTPHRLFFAHESRRWGGGTAFVDPVANASVSTPTRAWLITRKQFGSVFGQENGRHAYRSAPLVPAPGASSAVDERRYGLVMGLEPIEGIEAVTFTTPGQPLPDSTMPVAAYLDTIVLGLAESHDLDEASARELLRRCGGVARPQE